jgi:hypothetical protein
MNRNELSSVQLQILAAIAKRANNTSPNEPKVEKNENNRQKEQSDIQTIKKTIPSRQ